jgi:3-oxoacyl-[acyl-carrier-protein] synthase-1
MVPRCMSSTNSANLSTALKIKGLSYSISSACSTSAHCIGNAFELIQFGKQDVMLAGGGEELDWTLSVLFDAMPAMSSGYNDTPERASRAYDRDRDGYDMVAPSGEGGERSMRVALSTLPEGRTIDYINTHGTSTPVGDITELGAIREVFGDKVPAISSTKSLTGHSQGATGAHEAVYSLLMLRDDFIAASANIENLDPGAEGFPIVRERRDNAGLRQVMSNSFGFGGTNAVLVFRKFEG